MPPHQLYDIAVESDAGGKLETLVPVYECPLIVRAKYAAVAQLAGDLTVSDERVTGFGLVLQKMYEPVSGCGGKGGFRSQSFHDVNQTEVHDARNLSQSAQLRTPKEGTDTAQTSARRAYGAVAAAESTLRLVTESVANSQLPSLPCDFLREAHFLYLLQPNTVRIVVADSSEVVEGKIVMAPEPFQLQTAFCP